MRRKRAWIGITVFLIAIGIAVVLFTPVDGEVQYLVDLHPEKVKSWPVPGPGGGQWATQIRFPASRQNAVRTAISNHYRGRAGVDHLAIPLLGTETWGNSGEEWSLVFIGPPTAQHNLLAPSGTYVVQYLRKDNWLERQMDGLKAFFHLR
jgi:hypothetical protein